MYKSIPSSLNPLRIPDPAVAADLLSAVLNLETKPLLEKINQAVDNKRGFLFVKRKITEQESQKLRSYGLDWIEFRTESTRLYPKEQSAAHVIGSVNYEERGNNGVEFSLDKLLRGKPGVMRTQADVRQNVFDRKYFTDPQPGKNIKLTIDERIQYVAERELKKAVEKNNCKTGSIVVMNPKNGEILAMTSYPTFNPNEQPDDGEDLSSRLNLAVSAPFEPGSVFKVITIAAGLETTNITPHTIIPCGNGRMTLFKRVIHDHNSYASLAVEDVLAKSSNIGAIQIGLKVGSKRLIGICEAVRLRTRVPAFPCPGNPPEWCGTGKNGTRPPSAPSPWATRLLPPPCSSRRRLPWWPTAACSSSQALLLE